MSQRQARNSQVDSGESHSPVSTVQIADKAWITRCSRSRCVLSPTGQLWTSSLFTQSKQFWHCTALHSHAFSDKKVVWNGSLLYPEATVPNYKCIVGWNNCFQKRIRQVRSVVTCDAADSKKFTCISHPHLYQNLYISNSDHRAQCYCMRKQVFFPPSLIEAVLCFVPINAQTEAKLLFPFSLWRETENSSTMKLYNSQNNKKWKFTSGSWQVWWIGPTAGSDTFDICPMRSPHLKIISRGSGWR